ncbi:hypothetical protein Tco_0774120 [Tanacetum coccineum]|uniref:Reverse transcriptase domain-containing protein n=1 Tax=Tanacetum coccineum TaxID=301880 RepID=A0ABQ4ZMR1_9ASTR
MGEEDIKLNPLIDVDNLVPILRVSGKPLDSLDPILETFKMTITDPLFDFNYEFTLNFDNPILDIQNKESGESETDTIMDELTKMEYLILKLSLFMYSRDFGDIPPEIVPSVPHGRINSGDELSLDHFVEIPSSEIKVHIKVLSVLWRNRLSIPDGSLPLSRTNYESWSQPNPIDYRERKIDCKFLPVDRSRPFMSLEPQGIHSELPLEGGVLKDQKGPRTYRILVTLSKKRYTMQMFVSTNIMLQGLPKDIYKLINHNIEAKAIWDNIKMLLAGSELTKEDRESQLYDEFERFKMLPGENINEYYVRFHKRSNNIELSE